RGAVVGGDDRRRLRRAARPDRRGDRGARPHHPRGGGRGRRGPRLRADPRRRVGAGPAQPGPGPRVRPPRPRAGPGRATGLPLLRVPDPPGRPRVPAAEPTPADPAAVEAATLEGERTLLGRMPWGSNGTFLCEVTAAAGGPPRRAVYKPRGAERPLWDFPAGLDRREVAAYELSRALGWDLVPVTVLREDGPLGPGSLQDFVDADFEQH